MAELSLLPPANSGNTSNPFDSIKHTDSQGHEYWTARELMIVLGYVKWQKFEGVILKAQVACANGGNMPQNHFTASGNMVDIGSGSQREVVDYKLSRLACYLIAMNGDIRKKIIASAQTYFAIQARNQELALANPEDDLDAAERIIASLRQTRRELAALRENQQDIYGILGGQSQDITAINDRLDREGYYTVQAYCALYHLPCPASLAISYGKRARALSIERGLDILETPHPRYGKVGKYDQTVLAEVCRPPRNPGQLPLITAGGR